MTHLDDLLAGAAAAGFPVMLNEVLVDTGPLAVRVRIRVHGDVVHLGLRLLFRGHKAPRDNTFACRADRFLEALRELRDILQHPTGVLAQLLQ